MAIVWQAAIVFAVGLIVSLAMVPVAKRIAFRIGAVDYPSNRRVNKHPVCRCGGIALYVGFVAAVGVIYVGVHLFDWNLVNSYHLQRFNYPLLFTGITAMFALGLADDVFQLPAWPKFAGQVVAAALVAASGVSIGAVSLFDPGSVVELGWADIPVTVLYLVVFVNVINLIDGLDGLAAGIVAICCMAFLFLVAERGNFTMALVCLALVASCLGFLRYNFHPAELFMGDSGALFLGLMVGIISLVGVVRMQSIVVMVVPIVIAGVPVIDTAAAIVRRKKDNKPVGEPDMNHIHHVLLRSGLGQRGAVFVLYAATVVMACVAIALSNTTGTLRIVCTVVLVIVGLALICAFGLARPVLQHHYDRKGKVGRRTQEDSEAPQAERKIK